MSTITYDNKSTTIKKKLKVFSYAYDNMISNEDIFDATISKGDYGFSLVICVKYMRYITKIVELSSSMPLSSIMVLKLGIYTDFNKISFEKFEIVPLD